MTALYIFSPLQASANDFNLWLEQFKAEAAAQGISNDTIDNAFKNTKPIPKVIVLDRKQPEGTITFQKYRQNTVTPSRIQQGRKLLKQHADILKSVSDKYNVQPQYIVALWGMETNFGGYTGGFSTINALATLAHDGRRSEFFTSELLNALKIIDQGHISNDNMKGSWAGAMGQSQFMPSSFLSYAVDFNNDGKKDIWNTLPDVFGSAANYLASHGWKGDQRWGRAVQIPSTLSPDLIDSKNIQPLSFWNEQNIKTNEGAPIPLASEVKAALIQPGGTGSQAYLVYDNHRTIMKWNRSIYFATSVGLLADAISY